jgi:5'-nucleotidase
VTLEDVMTVIPFQNTVDLIEIQGKYLREAFEFCVMGYDPTAHHLAGKFLQVSGTYYNYGLIPI